MRDHRPRLTQDLINGSQLQQFTQHTKDLAKLQSTLDNILSQESRSLYRVANVRHNQVLIEVAHAALKTKLNYQRIQILSELRSNGFSHLAGIEFIINPNLYTAKMPFTNKTTELPSRHLSIHAVHALLSLKEVASPKLQKRIDSLVALHATDTSQK